MKRNPAHGVKLVMMRRVLYFAVIAALAGSAPDVYAGRQHPVPPDLVIKLERTSCYGECPIYTVTLDRDGNVVFEGTKFVRAQGRHTARIPATSVEALLDMARRIAFFDLRDSYHAMITDLPTTIVTITADGTTKRVEDYFGAPKELKQLEQDIDDAARTQRWIRIDAETVRELTREGRLGSPPQVADLLRHAVSSDDVDVVRVLLEAGADPNTRYYGTNTTPLFFARSAAAANVLLAAGLT